MRFPRILLLSLFVSLAAFAAPPVVTIEADGIYAAVPPGHTVAWGTSRVPVSTGIVTDADNDGRVKISTSSLGKSWVVFDVESREWAGGSTPISPLPSKTILMGTNGAYSVLYAPNASNGVGTPLWIRPGVGAWEVKYGYGYPSSRLYNGVGGGAIVDVPLMSPIGNSPATPAGFEDGDYLFLLGSQAMYGGLVDARLDDPPAPGVISMSSATAFAGEEKTFTTIALRNEGTAGTVSVLCSVSGTAVAGLDYPPTAPVTLVFGPGEFVKSCSVPLLDDGAFNIDARTVSLVLSDPTGGAGIGRFPAITGVINDDDPRPVLSLGTVPASVVEGDVPWTLDVPVGISGAFRGMLPITVYSTYTEGADQFVVAPGETQHIAKLLIPANDDIADYDRILTVRAGSTFATGNDSREITIIDDDPPPVLIGGGSAGTRAAEWSGVTLYVSTQWPTPRSGSVTWTTVDGTAKAGQDYVAATGTTPTGSYFYLSLLGDDANEGLEVFYVDVTSVAGAVLPPIRTRYEVIIVDDDDVPAGVIVQPIRITEGDATHTEPLHVKLTSPSQSRIRLIVNTTPNGTATPFKDYGANRSLVFEPGETEKDSMVTVYGDEDGEPDEVGEIQVLDRNMNVLTTTTVTLLDDDMATTPVVSLSSASPVEGNAGQTVVPITVKLAYALPVTVTMAIYSKDGTATGADYVPLSQGVKFLAGETEKTVDLAIIGDTLVEDDETVFIEILRTGSIIARMTLTIRDDDKSDATNLASLSDLTVVEKTGVDVNAVFRVTITPPPAAACTVKYLTEPGTASSADFGGTAGTLSFAPGQSTAEIAVPVFGDSIVEPDEEFTMRLYDANGVTLNDDRGVATIFDDDQVVRPVLSVEDVTTVEGDEQKVIEFTLRLSQAPPSPPLRITYETIDRTATRNGDYEPRAATATFYAGQTTHAVYVPIKGDDVAEETETFVLRLSNGFGMIVPDTEAICTILDDDSGSKRRATRH